VCLQQTNKQTRIHAHRLLNLNSRRAILNTHIRITDNSLGQYNFIFGRDYLAKGGIDLLFSNRTIQWDGMHTAMQEEISWYGCSNCGLVHTVPVKP
jgi:hypothetical protein